MPAAPVSRSLWRSIMSTPPSSSPANTKVLQGILAINKPPSLTSAACLRTLQSHFTPSPLFAPLISLETSRRNAENKRQKLRRRDRRPPQIKIGHGGTLDPLATGVLITGIGTGTKLLSGFLACTKTYEATVLFGVETDTYDRVGKVVQRAAYEHVTPEKVAEALEQFRGKIMQRPPIYSALRVNGRKMYDYARKGEALPVEIRERQVEVLELELVGFDEGGRHEHRWPTEDAAEEEEEKVVAEKILEFGPDVKRQQLEMAGKRGASESPPRQEPKKTKLAPAERDEANEPLMSGGLPPSPSPPKEPTPPCPAPAARLRMTVTSGFYVRSLCHDLGLAAGSLGMMSELVRTRQGDYALGGDKVLEWADLDKGEAVWGPTVARLLGGEADQAGAAETVSNGAGQAVADADGVEAKTAVA